MRCEFIKKGGCSLVLFVAGYGQELAPFERFKDDLAEDTALLMIWDYRNPQLSLPDFSAYAKVRLIAWSMGVMYAPALFYKANLPFERRIAVNGSCEGIDEELGISPKLWERTAAQMNDQNAYAFCRLMCLSPKLLKDYLKAGKTRDPKELKAELEAILSFARELDPKRSRGFYTEAYTCAKDLIFPPEAVKRSFARQGIEVLQEPGAHYCPELFSKLSAAPFEP